jgi:hypothetical protein
VAGEGAWLQARAAFGGQHGRVKQAVSRGAAAAVGLGGEQAEPAQFSRRGPVFRSGARPSVSE